MLPNFLIIGAARTGTTSLYQNLQSHPDVYLPKSKRPEPHFFLRAEAYARGLSWYEQQYFSQWSGQKAVGEASTSYFFGNQVPGRIAASLPECRFVLMLRDPVDRAYSNYWHSVNSGLETLRFDEAVARENERTAALAGTDMAETKPYSYLARSLYAEQFERWLSHFGIDRFCVLFFEDYVRSIEACLLELSGFLGIDAQGFSAAMAFSANKSTPEGVAMDAGLEKDLRSYFRQDILALQKLVGRDLSDWL